MTIGVVAARTSFAQVAPEAENGPPKPPGLPDYAAEISESMTAVMRAHSSLKARLSVGADADLAVVILLLKLTREGPRRAGELAEAMCADPSTVSRQVASLVRAGLIERQADPGDGRACLLVPTEAGRARVREFIEKRSRAIEPVIADWSADDRQAFVRLLRSYSEGLERHREGILAGFRTESLQSGDTRRERSEH